MDVFQHYRVGGYLFGFDEIQPDEDGPIYHGIMHAYLTALNCLEGAIHAGLGESECRSMIVAGLFHDALHSQGKYNDRHNVIEAVKQLTLVHSRAPEPNKLTDEEFKLAVLAIKKTVFIDGKYYGACNSVYSKIIRDADMMAVYCTDKEELKNMLLGLYAEINEKRIIFFEPALTLEEFRKQQLSFLGKVAWNTNWAKLKAVYMNWPQRCKDAVALLTGADTAIT